MAEIERRGADRHHAVGLASEIGIDALMAVGVPRIDGGLQGRGRDAHRLRQFFDRIGAMENPEFDLLQIIGAPLVMMVAAVGDGACDRIHLAAILVEDDEGGNAREVLHLRIVGIEGADAGVAGIGRILVHEALALLVHQDPGHAGQRFLRHTVALGVGHTEIRHLVHPPRRPHRHRLHVEGERIVRIAVLHAVGAMVVPHVPQIGADRLGHADAVAGIADERAGQHRLRLEILALHLRAVLVAAAGQDDGLAGADALLFSLDRGQNAGDLTLLVAQQPVGGGVVEHRHLAQCDVVFQNLEELGAFLDAADGAIRGQAFERRHRIDLAIGQRFVAGERIVSQRRRDFHLRADRVRQLLQIGRDLEHAFGQTAHDVVRGSPAAGRQQVLVALLDVVADPRAAGRYRRQAARIGHLLQNDDFGALIGRFYGGDGAGGPEADYDDVARAIPVGHGPSPG